MRPLIALLGLGLIAVLGWAGMQGGGDVAMHFLTATPWGIATTADLYLGFTLFGVLVWRLEGAAAPALAWWFATLVLGNLVPALYFVLRWPRIRALAQTHAIAAGAATTATEPER